MFRLDNRSPEQTKKGQEFMCFLAGSAHRSSIFFGFKLVNARGPQVAGKEGLEATL